MSDEPKVPPEPETTQMEDRFPDYTLPPESQQAEDLVAERDLRASLGDARYEEIVARAKARDALGAARCELDPPEPPEASPGHPGYERFKRLDVLFRGGADIYRNLFRENPPPDMVAEAEGLRKRLKELWGPEAVVPGPVDRITTPGDDPPPILSKEFEESAAAGAELLRRVEAGESVQDVFGDPPPRKDTPAGEEPRATPADMDRSLEERAADLMRSGEITSDDFRDLVGIDPPGELRAEGEKARALYLLNFAVEMNRDGWGAEDFRRVFGEAPPAGVFPPPRKP